MVMYVSPAFSGLDGSTDCSPGTSKNAKHGEYPEGWGGEERVMGIELRCVWGMRGKDGHQFTRAKKTECAGFKASLDGNAAGGLGNLNPSH